jgi:hypothetical protein
LSPLSAAIAAKAAALWTIFIALFVACTLHIHWKQGGHRIQTCCQKAFDFECSKLLTYSYQESSFEQSGLVTSYWLALKLAPLPCKLLGCGFYSHPRANFTRLSILRLLLLQSNKIGNEVLCLFNFILNFNNNNYSWPCWRLFMTLCVFYFSTDQNHLFFNHLIFEHFPKTSWLCMPILFCTLLSVVDCVVDNTRREKLECRSLTEWVGAGTLILNSISGTSTLCYRIPTT